MRLPAPPRLALGAALVLGACALLFVWPTAWTYRTGWREAKRGRYPVTIRTNRLTGREEVRFLGEWRDEGTFVVD